MAKKLSKIDPLDIDELFRSPSLEGMLSFREIDPATAAQRLAEKTTLRDLAPGTEEKRDPSLQPIPSTPIGAKPVGSERGGVKGGGATRRDLTPMAPATEPNPEPESPVPETPLSESDILAEVQDVSLLFRSRGRIVRATKVEDGHSGSENAMYWFLWRSGRHIRNSKSRFLQMGYALISKGVGLDRTNVQTVLRALESKLSLRVVTPGTVKSSTVYEIFSCEQILEFRRQAGYLWARRYGSRKVEFVDESENLAPVGLTPTPPTPGVGLTPTPPVGVTPIDSVGPRPILLVNEPTTQQSSSLVLEALSRVATPDDDAVRKLVDSCRAAAPDCTEAEIAHFIHEKASLVIGGRIANPLGFLLTAVPKCFVGESLAHYRRQEEIQHQQREEMRRRTEAEEATWKREQEAVLADPASSEEDKRFARQVLGITE